MIAKSPTIPTTTPAAIPAVSGLLSSGWDEGELTADVTGADVAADVGFEEELAEGVNVSTRLRVLPVRTTQSLPAPPPMLR
jgi:hypothetical protein